MGTFNVNLGLNPEEATVSENMLEHSFLLQDSSMSFIPPWQQTNLVRSISQQVSHLIFGANFLANEAYQATQEAAAAAAQQQHIVTN